MKTISIKAKIYEVIENEGPQDMGNGLTCAYILWEVPRKNKEQRFLGFRNPEAKPGTFDYNIIVVIKVYMNGGNVKFRKVGLFNEITSIIER